MQNEHQTVSRKFRPQLFSDVVGQEAVVTTLKNALKFARSASAYLFSGTRGTGKTTLARIYAKALNCKNLTSESSEPCNHCASCQEILSGNSLDVIEIDGASNRGIDDIRQINETVGYAPAGGSFKIYIIDEVHMLTKEAFNALLKTLEEPPSKVKFFLATTEAHKVPATIISRCQRFDLCRIPESLIMEKLQKIAVNLSRNVQTEALYKIALFAAGSLRDAESLFEQVLCYEEKEITEETIEKALGLVPSSLFFALDDAYGKGNLSFALTLVDSIYQSGKDLGSFLEQLAEHFRNILAYRQKKNPLLKRYQESSNLYSQEECLSILDLILQAMQTQPINRIHLEMLLLHILKVKTKTSIEKVVIKLLELEEKFASRSELPARKEVLPEEKTKAAAPLPEEVRETPKTFESEIPKKALDELDKVLPQETKVSFKEVPFSLKPKVESLPPKSTESSSSKEVEGALKQKEQSPPVVQEPPKKEPFMSHKNARYETLMRFAAVELEGTLKKEG